jgi:large subunit ribosomal protein L17
MRNLVTALVKHERIVTTEPKAKELRRLADKVVTIAKRGLMRGGGWILHAQRRAAAILYEKDAVKKLFTTLAPRFLERPGGYTRVIRIGRRKGDNAQMALIEYVERLVKQNPAGNQVSRTLPFVSSSSQPPAS